MDAHLMWDPATCRLEVKEFRRVQKGDLVAVATEEDGHPRGFWYGTAASRTRPTWTHDETFAFMASEVSREKPVNYEAIFEKFRRTGEPPGSSSGSSAPRSCMPAARRRWNG
jgi:hypothetical protein